ncbi:MAG: cytochrome c [Leptospiraceae bacterium]|nr:cytochrome c [Leptospiraceae bacterium]
MKHIIGVAVLILVASLVFPACRKAAEEDNQAEESTQDPMQNKGIGPVTALELTDIDPALAQKGAQIFEIKCSSCHKMDERHVGPALGEVTTRRSPEWIMNMILNPEEMINKDPIAEELYATYMTPMANQNLSQDEARAVLEYLRKQAKK